MLFETIQSIKSLDQKAQEKAAVHQNKLTKPQGSLGRLEELSIQLAGITGDPFFQFSDKRIVIMAADHGVVEEGVSAFPQEVTTQMVANFVSGGAAINVIARQNNAKVVCVDMGVNSDLSQLSQVENFKVRKGTRNFTKEAALTNAEVIQALENGIKVAQAQVNDGAQILATGEMGIGNTTTSSIILAVLSSTPIEKVVGRGTGIEDNALAGKINVIKQALELHQPNEEDIYDVLQKVGGLEICGLAGLIIGSAALQVPIVIDGFISTVAALCAYRICPEVHPYLIPSHLSEEPGHQIALEALKLKPIIHMNMRLGEGSGAALVFPMIDVSQRIMREMATFEGAGVSTKVEVETIE